LAIDSGRVVSTDRLFEDLWGGELPLAGVNALQGLVSKLRRVLGRPELVVHDGGGYRLDLPHHALDFAEFERLSACGHGALMAGDPTQAVALLDEALRLWRGPALVDFAYEELAQATISRLVETRATVLEDRTDASIALGLHAAVIGEIESLIIEYPLRERLRASLMLALYRAGRQTEALRAYQDGRAMLNDELGLEPGVELRRLEAAILAQDPSVDVPAHPPARPMEQRSRTNIAPPLTPLVGRAEELGAIAALVRDRRMVTLIGPGGVGKTRLAVETARASTTSYTSGAWMVELAPLPDETSVAAAIVSALGAGHPMTPPLSRLLEYLAGKELLLVLDNCEHVIGAAARITAELLGACPGLRVLATSREALGVPGEAVWPTPPLQPTEAVMLFVERATSADATFTLDPDAEPVVADICGRLDGLPLAVELAAARARAFGVEGIAGRLDDRFRLLTGGARTALPRQQTLRAVVDWSYDLLFDDERRLFDRLSVFAGSCTLAAAEAVCAGEGLPVVEVGTTLGKLVDKSLVVARRHGISVRYGLLQTLALYGRERLVAAGEFDSVRDRHAAHFAELAGHGAAAQRGDRQADWVGEVRADLDNFRSALAWTIERGDTARALTLAGGLGWFWWCDGGVGEGAAWLEAALALAGPAPAATRAVALTWSAYLGVSGGKAEAFGARSRDALEIAAGADPMTDGTTAFLIGVLDVARGDLDRAAQLFERARRAYASVDNEWARAAATFSEGRALWLTQQTGEAGPRLQEAAEGLRRCGDRIGAAMCLRVVAEVAEAEQDFETAAEAFRTALATATDFGLNGFAAMLATRVGDMALLLGDDEEAEVRWAGLWPSGASCASLPSSPWPSTAWPCCACVRATCPKRRQRRRRRSSCTARAMCPPASCSPSPRLGSLPSVAATPTGRSRGTARRWRLRPGWVTSARSPPGSPGSQGPP
jgi:predicted ATPase/DNA-binding SARP family transcriptional activator